jgi:hypothetical protein
MQQCAVCTLKPSGSMKMVKSDQSTIDCVACKRKKNEVMSSNVFKAYLAKLAYLKNALIVETGGGSFYIDKSSHNGYNCVGKNVNFYFNDFVFNKIHKIIFMDFDKSKESIVYESYT